MQASGLLHRATSWHSSLFPIKLRCASWHFIEIRRPACLLKRRRSRPLEKEKGALEIDNDLIDLLWRCSAIYAAALGNRAER